jgi:hypothetical protein
LRSKTDVMCRQSRHAMSATAKYETSVDVVTAMKSTTPDTTTVYKD